MSENGEPMRKLELRGAFAVLSENATAHISNAMRESCSPRGHTELSSGVLVYGRMVEKLGEYLTNGAAVDNAEAAHAKIMPAVDKRLDEMERKVIAACKTSQGDQTGAAFRVGKRQVSNEAYKKTVVTALSALILAVAGAIPAMVGSCNRSAEATATAQAEKAARIQQFAVAQSNNVAAIQRMNELIAKLEQDRKP